MIVSLATIVWSLRRQSRISVRLLLAGESIEPPALRRRRTNSAQIGGLVALAAAIALAAGLGGSTSGEEQAGVFFGSGFLVLPAALLLIWDQLRADRGVGRIKPGGTLARLAVRNGAASSAPQHSHHRIGGGGQFFDRRRQRSFVSSRRASKRRSIAATADSLYTPRPISPSIRI